MYRKQFSPGSAQLLRSYGPLTSLKWAEFLYVCMLNFSFSFNLIHFIFGINMFMGSKCARCRPGQFDQYGVMFLGFA